MRGPVLAEEGQKLLLGEHGKVRIQLLGSSREQVLQGSNLLVITRSELEKTAKPVDRGSIAVSDEIGSLSRPAAASARKSRVPHHVVGFALELPPVLVDGKWRAAVISPAEAFPAGGVQVKMRSLDDKDHPVGLEVTQPTDYLIFPESVMLPGGRYELEVKGPRSAYYREFQLLTTEEREDLERTASVLRAEALQDGEIAMLLRLAGLYAGFDETQKLADVLVEVVNRPDFKSLDQESQNKVKETLNQTLRSLDRKNYEGF